MGEPDWFQNDEYFFEQLDVGHRWARKVADVLVERGIDAAPTPLQKRETIEDRHKFSNEADLLVKTAHGPVTIEIKSRDLEFSGEPSSYPYRTAFVDTVSGWDRKQDPPRAVVLVSQRTSEMLVISVAGTRSTWTKARGRDRNRNVCDLWYEVPREKLQPMEDLVTWLESKRVPT